MTDMSLPTGGTVDLSSIELLVEQVRSARLPSPAKRKSIRKAAGVTLREVAAALGVDPMTVWRWEQGGKRGTNPNRERAVRYRALLAALEEAIGE
jgi:DNA-binding XRE family transcriptional regulator